MSDKNLIKQKWTERYPRKFPKRDPNVQPVPGAIAVSRAGRDRYRRFIILAVIDAERCESRDRVLLCDGVLRSVASPKKKNLAHVILIGMSNEAAALIAAGALTDKDAARICGASLPCADADPGEFRAEAFAN